MGLSIYMVFKLGASKPKDKEAFLDRWKLVSFPNQFLEGDPRRDDTLKYKLTTPEELSGVLNWALEGLTRLLKRSAEGTEKGKIFSKGATFDKAADRWEVEGDSVKAFYERCVVDTTFGDAGNVPVEQSYQEYKDFCKRHDVSAPQPYKVFAARLRELGLSGDSTRIEGRSVRVWQNIRIEHEEED